MRGHLIGYVEHGDVHRVEAVLAERAHLDLLTADGELAAGGAGGGDQADLAPHVGAGGEEFQHDRADGAGGADDGEGRFASGVGLMGHALTDLIASAGVHRPVPP